MSVLSLLMAFSRSWRVFWDHFVVLYSLGWPIDHMASQLLDFSLLPTGILVMGNYHWVLLNYVVCYEEKRIVYL
jgi:hypothetical protein